MAMTGLLLALSLTAAMTDLRSHKVFNWNTYPGILLGLALNALSEVLPLDAAQQARLGCVGLEESLKGFAACGGLMLACFVLFNVGGGDVKLMAMLGAFLGFEQGLLALLWTFVLGGAVGLAVLIWRVGFVRLVGGSLRHVLWTLRLGSWLPLTGDERAQLQPALYLAPMAVLAVVIVRFSLI